MRMKSLVEKFLSQVPQYTRKRRHARSVWKHGTARKWANLATVEIERKLRRIRVKGYPYILFLDPFNYCNLRCPLCATGRNDLGRTQAMLSLEHFQKYFDDEAGNRIVLFFHIFFQQNTRHYRNQCEREDERT